MIEDTSNLPIPYTSVTAMVSAWLSAAELLRQGQEKIKQAQDLLAGAFLPTYRRLTLEDAVRDGHRVDPLNTAEVLAVWKTNAWTTLFERMEVKRICSERRAKELDDLLKDPKNLPDITEENVLNVLRSTLEQIPDMLAELVKEVYDWLRPNSSRWLSDYKTNEKCRFAVGRKVIKTWCVELRYSQPPGPRVIYGREQHFRGLDGVFQMLDGKGAIKTHYGPSYDVINKATFGDWCETEYFRFKAYRNGNLHIEFKRADLLAKFNAMAGADKLAPSDNNE